MQKILKLRIVSVSPLLMHNGQLADPLNEHAKAIAQIAAKRKKTEADFLRLAELEFFGSLWLTKGRPCIPAESMESALVRAAGQERRAQKVRAGLFVADNLKLEYEGNSDINELSQNEDFRLRTGVRVGSVRVMRTRPMFKAWSANLTIHYAPDLLNEADIINFVSVAGQQVGIGDWRPRFGRFMLEDRSASNLQSDQRRRRK